MAGTSTTPAVTVDTEAAAEVAPPIAVSLTPPPSASPSPSRSAAAAATPAATAAAVAAAVGVVSESPLSPATAAAVGGTPPSAGRRSRAMVFFLHHPLLGVGGGGGVRVRWGSGDAQVATQVATAAKCFPSPTDKMMSPMTKVLGGRGGLGKFHLAVAAGGGAPHGRVHHRVPSHRKTGSASSVARFVDGAAEAAEATAALAAAAEGGERGMARRAMAQSFLSASKSKGGTASRTGGEDDAPLPPPLFYDATADTPAAAGAPASAPRRRERVVEGAENPATTAGAAAGTVKLAHPLASPAAPDAGAAATGAVARTPLAPRAR